MYGHVNRDAEEAVTRHNTGGRRIGDLHPTFLQALMDAATVLSALPPSTLTASEPSNMADDWKLLRGREGTELTLSEQVLVKCSALLFSKKKKKKLLD